LRELHKGLLSVVDQPVKLGFVGAGERFVAGDGEVLELDVRRVVALDRQAEDVLVDAAMRFYVSDVLEGEAEARCSALSEDRSTVRARRLFRGRT